MLPSSKNEDASQNCFVFDVVKFKMLRKPGRQTDRQTARQAGRQTDRQTER